MRCYACQAELVPDHMPNDKGKEPPYLVNGEPPEDFDPWEDHYQFEGALWIGLHGGYGMFTDQMAGWPTNSEDRWIDVGTATVVEDPDWKPEYAEKRMLPGRPDHEAVICHDCAHVACDALPWLKRLIDPWASHSHRTSYVEENPTHYGWDYSRRAHPELGPTDRTPRPPEHEVPT